MTTFSARKKARDVISVRTYLKRYAKDPKSVEGARIVTPRLGRGGFGRFIIERDVPLYEVLPSRKG